MELYSEAYRATTEKNPFPHTPVEKEQRREGHGLGGDGPVFLRSLVGQVSADLTYPQLSRMALAVEADEVHNIVQIRGFSTVAHLSQGHSRTDLAEEGRRLRWRRRSRCKRSSAGCSTGSMPSPSNTARSATPLSARLCQRPCSTAFSGRSPPSLCRIGTRCSARRATCW